MYKSCELWHYCAAISPCYCSYINIGSQLYYGFISKPSRASLRINSLRNIVSRGKYFTNELLKKPSLQDRELPVFWRFKHTLSSHCRNENCPRIYINSALSHVSSMVKRNYKQSHFRRIKNKHKKWLFIERREKIAPAHRIMWPVNSSLHWPDLAPNQLLLSDYVLIHVYQWHKWGRTSSELLSATLIPFLTQNFFIYMERALYLCILYNSDSFNQSTPLSY